MDDSALVKVERQRLELESNIVKLKRSLRYWQTLELDYEGLREELQGLPPDSTNDTCFKIAQEFCAELIDEKELRSLTEARHQPQQITHLLSKRVEYCLRNEGALKSQISDAEKKRNTLLLAGEPAFRDVAGLPLTEITEELDQEDRIISTKLQTADTAAPQLAEVLRKAGVEGITNKDGLVIAKEVSTAAEDTRVRSVSTTEASKPARTIAGVAVEPEESMAEETAPSSINPAVHVNPDDTEDEAALRMDMLQYGIDEVGAIVAELDLEDADTDVSLEDDVDDDSGLSDFEGEDGDEEESEDEKGMTKTPIISERYRRKMEQLEKKLGLKDMQNLGPDPVLPIGAQDSLDRPAAAEAARQAAIARAEAAKVDADSAASSKKGPSRPRAKPKKIVAFAESLDIAPKSTEQSITKGHTSLPHPINDSIVERAAAVPATAVTNQASAPGKRTSRFKAARANAPHTPLFNTPNMDFRPDHAGANLPAIPHDTISTSLIVERDVPQDSEMASTPVAEDIDERLHQREIAIEHRQLHNRMVYRQGGFVHDGEEDNFGDATATLPVEDEDTGITRKVSRFKAARVK